VAYSADHSGLPAVLKAAYPYDRYWAYRPDDSAAHYLAAVNCWAGPADDSVVHYLAAACCWAGLADDSAAHCLAAANYSAALR